MFRLFLALAIVCTIFVSSPHRAAVTMPTELPAWARTAGESLAEHAAALHAGPALPAQVGQALAQTALRRTLGESATPAKAATAPAGR